MACTSRFGKVADVWKPSAGAPSSSRSGPTAAAGGQKWNVLAANQAAIGGASSPGVGLLNPDGSFTATLTVTDTWTGIPATGTYGIYTYGGGGATSTGYETFTPITFAAPPAPNTQTITATVPQPAPGGDFTWTIDATDHTVDLGTLSNQGAYLQAVGEIKPVKVTDTRTGQANSWSVAGQLSDFSNGLDGKYLGWTPKVVTAGAGAVAGAAVASGYDGGDGLTTSSSLGSAPTGHATGTGTLGADLDLKVPAETAAGTYTATLTLTALS